MTGPARAPGRGSGSWCQTGSPRGAAREREVGVEIDRAAVAAVSVGDRADHHRGIEDMVVEREVVARDVRDSRPMLAVPGRHAESLCLFDQRLLVELAGPVALDGVLELAMRPDPGKAERGDDH